MGALVGREIGALVGQDDIPWHQFGYRVRQLVVICTGLVSAHGLDVADLRP